MIHPATNIDTTPGIPAASADAADWLEPDLLDLLISEHEAHTRPALERLWAYYRNPLDFDGGDAQRRYTVGQAAGLPDRLRRTDDSAGREHVRRIVRDYEEMTARVVCDIR